MKIIITITNEAIWEDLNELIHVKSSTQSKHVIHFSSNLSSLKLPIGILPCDIHSKIVLLMVPPVLGHTPLKNEEVDQSSRQQRKVY